MITAEMRGLEWEPEGWEPPQDWNNPKDPDSGGQTRVRAGAGARAFLYALIVGIPVRSSRAVRGWWGALWGRVRDCSPYTDTPASIRDVVDYTHRGGWVPGDHPWWVEAPGKVYGYVVAVPLTVVAHAVVWVAQRPWRVLITTGVYVGVRLCGVDLLAWVPVDLLWVGWVW